MKFVETRRERVYDGFLKIDKLYFKQENVNGEWTEEFSREVIYRRNAVAILLIDPITKKLAFTKQLRPGSYIQGEPWIYEMVAGLIDPNEDMITALKREVKEEIGIYEVIESGGGENDRMDRGTGAGPAGEPHCAHQQRAGWSANR